MHLIYNKSLFFLICKKGRCEKHNDLFHKYSLACKFDYILFSTIPILMSPPGFEPGTPGLKVQCSTN